MGYCPENTMVSFERAAELGADWVELDVHTSRDDGLVVIHDDTLDRTTSVTGRVVDHSMDELTALGIPTLDQVLTWAKARGIGVDVEIKQAPVEVVLEAIQGMLDQVLVSSFNHPAMQRMKLLDSRVATGVLYAHRPLDSVALARDVGADWLLPHWSYVVQDEVDAAHAAGLKFGTWATSEPSVLRALVASGVDAIATNHPDVLRRLLDPEPSRFASG
jgi:glycerophosphoryl diester phosphodiesterase